MSVTASPQRKHESREQERANVQDQHKPHEAQRTFTRGSRANGSLRSDVGRRIELSKQSDCLIS
jgi:hypothetical protein